MKREIITLFVLLLLFKSSAFSQDVNLKKIWEIDIYDPIDFVVKQDSFQSNTEILLKNARNLIEILKEILNEKKISEIFAIENFFDAQSIPYITLESERREEIVRRLERFISKYPRSQGTPLAMLRLAELYFEKANEEYLISMQLAQLGEDVEPKKDYSKSVKIYEDFLTKYPEFYAKDVVMYLAGFALSEMGDTYTAVLNYFEPLSKMRHSTLCAEASMRTAEFYFDAGELSKAEEFYKNVLDFPQSPFYSKAMYKLAWTYFRMGMYDLAADYFVESVNVSSEEEVQLKDESISFLIASVAELGGPGKITEERRRAIISALRTTSKDPELFFAKSTADLYLKQGKYSEAYETYISIIKQYYKSPDSIDAAYGAAESLKRMGNLDALADLKIEMALKWGPRSEWSVQNPERAAKERQKLETGLLESAKYFHEISSKNPEILDKAESSYRTFLSLFPTSEFSAEVNFLLAEIYFSEERFQDSYIEYKNVVENVVVSENKYLYDAAWGMVISADELFKRGAAAAGEKLKHASFSFEKLFPLDDKTPKALYKAALVLETEGEIDESLRILTKIVGKYFTSEVAYDAIFEIAKIYVDTKQYQKIIDWVEKVKTRRDIIKKDEDILKLVELASSATFKIAKQMEEEGRVEDAIKTYLSIPRKYPNTTPATEALYNAVVLSRDLNKFSECVKYSNDFISVYPQSPLIWSVIFEQALCFEKMFMFDEALKSYGKVLRQKIKTDEFKYSLLNSIKIVEGLGRWNEASELLLEYYEHFKNEKGAENYLFRAAFHKKEGGDVEGAIKIFERFLESSEKQSANTIYARMEIAKFLLSAGKDKEGKKKLRELLERWNILDSKTKAETLSYAAEARFILAQDLFQEFESMKLEIREKKRFEKELAKKLEEKAKLLKKVQSEFSEIAALGDPIWTFASLFYIGFSVQRFAETLYEAPLPPDLTEDEKVIYQEELRNQAFPLEDQAKEIYSKNLKKAREMGIKNEWTEKTEFYLKRLDPLHPVEIADDLIKPAKADISYYYRFSNRIESEREREKKGTEKQEFIYDVKRIAENKMANTEKYITIPFFILQKNGTVEYLVVEKLTY